MKRLWILPIGVAIAYGAFLIQKHESAAMPHTIQGPPSADTVTPSSLDNSIDEKRLQHLRGELSLLEKRIAKRELHREKRYSKRTEHSVETLFEGGLSPDQWQRQGYKSPDESVETFLWAGASGNLEAMRSSIELDEERREQAKQLYNRLPLDARARFQSSEELVAALIIDEIPITRAQILSESVHSENSVSQKVVFTSNVDSPEIVTLKLHRKSSGEWKVAVPQIAIKNYATTLQVTIDPTRDQTFTTQPSE